MFYASTALNLWVASLLTLVLVAAAAVDVRCGKIPNLITFPAILLFLGFHLLAGGATGFLGSLAGLAAGLTAMLAPYCMGRLLGAGDVKLMAAVGAALGVEGLISAFLATCLAGGVQAGIYLFWQSRGSSPYPRATGKSRLRYGVSIAAGSIAAMAANFYGFKLLSLI